MHTLTDQKITWNTQHIKQALLAIRAVDHKLRQRIIDMLHEAKYPERQLTVTDIYVKLRIDQSVASQHLAILRRAGVVYTEREGKFIIYSLDYARIEQIKEAVEKFVRK